MLTYEQALEMLKLVDESNSRSDKQWRTLPHNFLRDAYRYMAKHLDSGSNHDLQLVWRAMLSEWIINAPEEEKMEDIAGLLASTMSDQMSERELKVLAECADPLVLIDSFVHLASSQIFNANIFQRLLEVSEFSWDDMHKLMKEKA